jgi:hypothetical protein
VKAKKHLPFPFILDELDPLRPVIKNVSGFTYVYVGDTLLCALRDNQKQPGTNGLWLFTEAEHLQSLAKDFPDLPKRQFWRSGKKSWIILASRLPCFEEYALKACELMLNGDRRIGRVTRGALTISKPYAGSTGHKNSLIW